MEQDDAEKLLRDRSPGTFLIRFSTSMADKGYFVLAVRMTHGGAIQVQIEVSINIS